MVDCRRLSDARDSRALTTRAHCEFGKQEEGRKETRESISLGGPVVNYRNSNPQKKLFIELLVIDRQI